MREPIWGFHLCFYRSDDEKASLLFALRRRNMIPMQISFLHSLSFRVGKKRKKSNPPLSALLSAQNGGSHSKTCSRFLFSFPPFHYPAEWTTDVEEIRSDRVKERADDDDSESEQQHRNISSQSELRSRIEMSTRAWRRCCPDFGRPG